jgi:hypothetical protein
VAVVSLLGAGLAAAMLGALLHLRGGPAIAGALVVVLPGAIDSMKWFGTDLLALGLAAAGILLWRDGRAWPAAAAFSAAALARETLLLVPAGLLIAELLRHRRPAPPWWLVPPAIWMGWQVVVRWRFEAWPWDGGPGRLAFPFSGLADALPHWDPVVGSIAAAALALGPILAVLVLRPRDPLTAVAALFLVLGVVTGTSVWVNWSSFSRVLMPGYVFAAVALLGPSPAPAASTAVTPTSA